MGNTMTVDALGTQESGIWGAIFDKYIHHNITYYQKRVKIYVHGTDAFEYFLVSTV